MIDDAVAERKRAAAASGYYANTDYPSYYYTNGRPIGFEGVDFGNPAQKSTAVAAYSALTNPGGAKPVAAAGGAGQPYNPYKTISNVKSQPIADALSGQIDLFKSYGQANQNSLNDYLNQFKTASGDAVSNLNQESGAIADIYNPAGLRGRLSQNLNDYSTGVSRIADRSLSKVLRDLSARQMGAGAGGTSSYFSSQAQDKAAGIEAQRLADVANRRTAMEQYLTSAQTGAAGLRNRLSDQVLQLFQQPMDVRNRLLSANAANLGNLSQIDLANNFYGLMDPNTSAPVISLNSAFQPRSGGNDYSRYMGPSGSSQSNYLNAIQKILSPRQRTSAPVNPDPFGADFEQYYAEQGGGQPYQWDMNEALDAYEKLTNPSGLPQLPQPPYLPQASLPQRSYVPEYGVSSQGSGQWSPEDDLYREVYGTGVDWKPDMSAQDPVAYNLRTNPEFRIPYTYQNNLVNNFNPWSPYNMASQGRNWLRTGKLLE